VKLTPVIFGNFIAAIYPKRNFARLPNTIFDSFINKTQQIKVPAKTNAGDKYFSNTSIKILW
jgi:hypothetical protein